MQENLKEISFFEDPDQHEQNRQAAKQKEIKQSIRRFNQHPKKGSFYRNIFNEIFIML